MTSCRVRADSRIKCRAEGNGGGRIEMKISQKILFSKGIIRCIIKVAKEGDIVDNGADTSRGFRAFEITSVYGR